MAHRCCSSVFKFLLTTVNVILFLFGIALLCFGIAVLANPDEVLDTLAHVGIHLDTVFTVTGEDTGSIVKSSGTALIVIGLLIGCISMYGCYGACCENKCMLGTHAAALIILIIAELAIIILVQAFRHKIHEPVREGLVKSFGLMETDLTFNASKVQLASDESGGAWARLQFIMECCGVDDYANYGQSFYNFTADYSPYFNGKPLVAASCCKLNGKQRIPVDYGEFDQLASCLGYAAPNATHTAGCEDAVQKFINKYSDVVSAILGAVAVIELFLAMFAIYLCKESGKSLKAV